jgi:hypothetical protein
MRDLRSRRLREALGDRMSALIPVPRCEMTVRVAAMGDYTFIDRLQDMHSKALGFMRKAALEGKIKLGEVLIAEDQTRLPIGYCIFSNRYLKRDELGVIYQMNVLPVLQRKLIGATLLKGVFERAPYGCRLFCCWCAQDLDANYFWESMGFVPLAFRTGAVGKRTRTHIFWQRRIREGDTTTPYWFPAKTDGGMMREDRLVLPIPPGVHWRDAMPVLLPTAGVPEVHNALPAPATRERSSAPKEGESPKPQVKRRVQFGPPSDAPEAVVEKVKLGAKPAKPKRAAREKVKADPVLVAKARELRDRWLEQVNAHGEAPSAQGGKYDISRQLPAAQIKPAPLLGAA